MLMTKSRNDILNHFESIFSIFSLIHVCQAIIPLFLTYILLSNLTEGTIVSFCSSLWVVYVTISYLLVIAKRDQYAIAE